MTDEEAADLIRWYLRDNPDHAQMLENAFTRGWHPVQIAEKIILTLNEIMDQYQNETLQ